MKVFIQLLILFSISISNVLANEIDSLLNILEQTMLERNAFDLEKEQRIEEIKKLINNQSSPEDIYYLNKQIINEYEVYILDSAIYYVNLNISLAKRNKLPSLEDEAKLTLSKLLTSTGRYIEAIDIIKTVRRKTLSEDLIEFYYENYLKVYSELAFGALVSSSRDYYADLYDKYKDSLMVRLKPNTEKYLFILEKQYRDDRQLDECEKINSKRLALTKMGTRIFSMVNFERSLIYELNKKPEMEKKHLALSAISDIQASVKDNASLTRLALLLYREGMIDKAFKYINFSFEDAKFYNSKLRFIALSSIFPVITEAYELKSENQKQKLRLSTLFISLLAFILLVAMTYIYRQLKNLARTRNKLELANKEQKKLNKSLYLANDKLNNLNKELSETNHVKEQYIGNFLGICSNYIDKLDAYRKMVSKHISTRKIAELYELTKSRQLIDSELNEFYENFDNTFLKIYPDFVSEFNKLLVEEEQILLKKNEMLNTELRIFALIRLGINDSSKIASLLRYSVNTIYNYRAKIKNHAAGEREEFENKVMQIGAFV